MGGYTIGKLEEHTVGEEGYSVLKEFILLMGSGPKNMVGGAGDSYGRVGTYWRRMILFWL